MEKNYKVTVTFDIYEVDEEQPEIIKQMKEELQSIFWAENINIKLEEKD